MKMRYNSLFLITLCFTQTVFAASHQYKGMLIGERATGMGGAYIGIADDPSGIFHNPAGIIFANENYLSVSANAFTTGEQSYQQIIGSSNYTYRSEALVPSFIGFTQSIGKSKWGFAIITPQADLYDQDDNITNISTTTGQASSFQRKFYLQDFTYLFGPAFATEISNNIGIGFTLFAFYRTEKIIDQQWIQMNPLGTGGYEFRNVSQTRTAKGLLPKLGIQAMVTPKVSIGAVVDKSISVDGSGRSKAYSSKTTAKNGQFDNDVTYSESSNVYYKIPSPLHLGSGLSYFPSQKMLLACDLDYYSDDPEFKDYALSSVVNWSLGMEYFTSSKFAWRFGLYSNNSNTPKISETSSGLPPHVDMLGSTASFSSYQPGSSFSVGLSYATGTGQGQGFGNSQIQTVKQTQMALYIMGGYQM